MLRARPAGHYLRLSLTPPTTIETPQVLSESDLGRAAAHVNRSIETYIERCRQRIPAFVESHFTLAQSWRVQRRTLWLDLACAPLNTAWALPNLAIQKAVDPLEKVGYTRLAQCGRQIPRGIRTGYQREIERLICTELLEWDREQAPEGLPQGFLEELRAAPALGSVLETPQVRESDRACARTLRDHLRQFSSGRAVVSDLAGTLLTLALSWWIAGNASLSLKSIAHGIAQKSAHDRKASRFFLGKKAGSHFYNVFKPKVDEGTIWTVLVLLVVGLTVGAMACTILSDPLRRFLGFHRNRLETLVSQVEKELIVFSHKSLKERRQGPC